VKEWVAITHAIGLQAKACRYGGTNAHPDIAFELCMGISAEFKIYLVKEFQRLKEEEQKQLGRNVKQRCALQWQCLSLRGCIHHWIDALF